MEDLLHSPIRLTSPTSASSSKIRPSYNKNYNRKYSLSNAALKSTTRGQTLCSRLRIDIGITENIPPINNEEHALYSSINCQNKTTAGNRTTTLCCYICSSLSHSSYLSLGCIGISVSRLCPYCTQYLIMCEI